MDSGQESDEQMMSVRVDDRPGAVVLTVGGEVDGLTVPRLRAAIAEAFARLAGRALVIDLTAVTFFGSPGLSVLLEGAHQAVHHDGRPALRIVTDHARPVLRPIETMGLDAVLALYPDMAAALRGDVHG